MRKVLYIFGQLSDEDVEWICRNAQKEHVVSGNILIKENEPTKKLYILISGSYSVISELAGDKEINRLKSGEVVGEMSFVDHLPPSATVIALEKGIVISIDRELLSKKLEDDFEFASHFYKSIGIFLSGRLRSTTSMLGYGKEQKLDEDTTYSDEVDPNVLENLSLAGDRFTRLMDHFS
mgnify:CR=1 FL=1